MDFPKVMKMYSKTFIALHLEILRLVWLTCQQRMLQYRIVSGKDKIPVKGQRIFPILGSVIEMDLAHKKFFDTFAWTNEIPLL